MKFRKVLLMPVAKALIKACRFFPSLRPGFSRIGITPRYFGTLPVRIPIPESYAELLMSGADDNDLSFQLFWQGIDYYEPFSRTAIEMLTASRPLFIDVGANIGFFSLVASKLNPKLQVIAFEPNPKMYSLLSEHKHLNKLSNLTVEQVALSDHDGEARLFLSKSDMSASLTSGFQESFSPATDSVQVKIKKLDSYLKTVDVQSSFVLKVDVEGHDQEFLKGASDSIVRFKPDIVIEVLEDFDRSILARLRDLGYTFYQITHQGLLKTDAVGLTRIGDFVFFNYLLTTRQSKDLEQISEVIKKRAGKINLYHTSKFPKHPI